MYRHAKSLIAMLAVLGVGITLAGCEEETDATLSNQTTAQITKKNAEVTTKPTPVTTLSSIHTVLIDGHPFKFKASYSIPKTRANNWYFTQPSTIDLKIKPLINKKLYKLQVSEVYADVTLVSPYARYNGVRQDSTDLKFMDMPSGGMSINTRNTFDEPFQVEGINQNETSVYVINGYGSSDTSRITERDLRESVQGAALKTVWTVTATKKSSGETYAKTITDSIGLPYKHHIDKE